MLTRGAGGADIRDRVQHEDAQAQPPPAYSPDLDSDHSEGEGLGGDQPGTRPPSAPPSTSG